MPTITRIDAMIAGFFCPRFFGKKSMIIAMNGRISSTRYNRMFEPTAARMPADSGVPSKNIRHRSISASTR